MAISSMKNLIRRSVQKKQFGSAITASQIVTWGNEFLKDILPIGRDQDARVVSYHDKVLKIVTKSGATNQYIHGFETELRECMMEKFHDTKLDRITFQIDRRQLDELL